MERCLRTSAASVVFRICRQGCTHYHGHFRLAREPIPLLGFGIRKVLHLSGRAFQVSFSSTLERRMLKANMMTSESMHDQVQLLHSPKTHRFISGQRPSNIPPRMIRHKFRRQMPNPNADNGMFIDDLVRKMPLNNMRRSAT